MFQTLNELSAIVDDEEATVVEVVHYFDLVEGLTAPRRFAKVIVETASGDWYLQTLDVHHLYLRSEWLP